MGPGTPVAVVVAAVGVWQGFALAARLRWRCAARHDVRRHGGVDARARVRGRPVGADPRDRQPQRVPAHRPRGSTTSRPMLRGFVDRIPAGAPGSWETHVAGHPPGALLLFVGLVSVGLGSAFASAVTVTLIGCTTPGGRARRPAAPGSRGRREAGRAVPGAGSGGDLGGGVGRRGVRRRGRLGAGGRGRGDGLDEVGPGAGAGVCSLASCSVAACCCPTAWCCSRRWSWRCCWPARSWRPLPAVALGASCRCWCSRRYGFRLWEAYPVLNDRYWAGIAARPARGVLVLG